LWGGHSSWIGTRFQYIHDIGFPVRTFYFFVVVDSTYKFFQLPFTDPLTGIWGHQNRCIVTCLTRKLKLKVRPYRDLGFLGNEMQELFVTSTSLLKSSHDHAEG
jgi:hypothetical protein